MTIALLALLVAVGSFGAGLLGALTGLGGGIVVVPMLTLLFHVDLRYAIGASLVSVIATSSGAAAAYVREGYTNVRVGIFLEVATTVGALVGAALAGLVPTSALAVLFGLVLLYTAYRSFQVAEEHVTTAPPHPWAARLRLDGAYPTSAGMPPYTVQAVAPGLRPLFAPRGPPRRRHAALHGAGGARGLRAHVRRRRALRAARHRLGRRQGARHGPQDAAAVQGLHHDEQLHDRGHRRRERGRVPAPRLHRPSP